MTPDFHADAVREAQQSAAYRQWVGMRVEVLHSKVQPEDVLTRYGVKLRFGGNRPEQFSCPFHGKDNKPSTRYYPAEGRKPAAVWCFVCQERWDSITLFKKFEQLEVPFTRLITMMERAFGLPTPEMPKEAHLVSHPQENTEVLKLFEVCEKRLKSARTYFKLDGYLKVGSVLDRLQHQLQHGKQDPAKALMVLRQVLNKIGEKERAA